MTVTLVTGGVRSGKSRHAESLLAGVAEVTYVATHRPPTGTEAGDPAWAERVARHRARRPATWTTVETLDVGTALDAASGPVIVECLGTWLTGLVDDAAAWGDLAAARDVVRGASARLVTRLGAAASDVVVVTNEVGLTLVATTASGRFFQDELGTLNAAVAAVCDHVHLVVAGRVLDLGEPPRPGS